MAERYVRRKQAFACPWPMAAPAAPRQAPMPAAMPVSVAPATAPQPARCDERRPGARAGFLFPVVSGSGGAGKSTVSVLSALFAQRMGYNTLLLDFDLQFGDMAQLMGVKKPLRIDEVLARPERLGQLACEGKVPALLAAPEHVDAAEAVVARAGASGCRARALRRDRGEHGAARGPSSMRCCWSAARRPCSWSISEPPRSHATQRALDLCARCGIAVNPFLFTLNGCGKGAPLSSMDVSCALKGAHVHELPDGGADVEELLAAGLVVDLIDSRNDLFEGVEELMTEILPGVSAAAGSSREGPGMPFLRGKRSRKRKKA